MFSKFTIAIFMMITTVAGLAFARDCAMEGDVIAISECHMDRYAAADKEMNVIFHAAMKSLPGDSKVKLKNAQKAWLKYRDASFALIVEMNKDRQSYGRLVVADYKATFVEKRVREMKHVLAGPQDAVQW